ncbi:eukaryotic translation initiation factor 4E isoform X1 [Procambarus clarkii]|uniref:eukaryotic translation initiation factor 4E isoform X1 n=1 Tax=Procambarus clarkii TaxID=6728 RepID=UPI001E6709C5|nr:eukaryotic translation initiation factor 4E-like isoform X1 [Procambarus clarkii]
MLAPWPRRRRLPRPPPPPGPHTNISRHILIHWKEEGGGGEAGAPVTHTRPARVSQTGEVDLLYHPPVWLACWGSSSWAPASTSWSSWLNDKQQEQQGEEEGKEQQDVSPDMLIKHPLQNTWTLWFFKIENNRTWEDCQMEIASFNTVEDFWALYNHIEPASRLKVGCDYSMFKQGVKPMWEDEHNCRGGRWLINLNKQQRSSDLDNFWMEVLLLMIGEAFEDHSEEVCGAVVNVRSKGDKIGVWTADAKKNESILKIGHVLKERLNIPRHVNIGFQAHTDTMIKSGSTAKNRFTV